MSSLLKSRTRSKSPVPKKSEEQNKLSAVMTTGEKENSAPEIHHKYRMSQKLKENCGLSHVTKDEGLIFAQQRYNEHLENVQKLSQTLIDLDASTRAKLNHEDSVISQLEAMTADSPLEEIVQKIAIDQKKMKTAALTALETRHKLLMELCTQWKDGLKKTHNALKKEQEGTRMDFDHYSTKVDTLRKKLHPDETTTPTLERNEEKLKTARSIYHDTTDTAVRVYDTMCLDGWNDLVPILDTFLDQGIALATIQSQQKAFLQTTKTKLSSNGDTTIPAIKPMSTRIPFAKAGVVSSSSSSTKNNDDSQDGRREEEQHDDDNNTTKIVCPTSTGPKSTSVPPLPKPKVPSIKKSTEVPHTEEGEGK
mmetsp:Transcript_408/g.537  ORF Transcript_408/g.537 Transcript_408/m.537 type:complete len:365 (-) Transcript_408:328-1422(-)